MTAAPTKPPTPENPERVYVYAWHNGQEVVFAAFPSSAEAIISRKRHTAWDLPEMSEPNNGNTYIRFNLVAAEIAAAVAAERERVAWLAEGMANKLHTFDAETVASCLGDLVTYLRSDL